MVPEREYAGGRSDRPARSRRFSPLRRRRLTSSSRGTARLRRQTRAERSPGPCALGMRLVAPRGPPAGFHGRSLCSTGYRTTAD